MVTCLVRMPKTIIISLAVVPLEGQRFRKSLQDPLQARFRSQFSPPNSTLVGGTWYFFPFSWWELPDLWNKWQPRAKATPGINIFTYFRNIDRVCVSHGSFESVAALGLQRIWVFWFGFGNEFAQCAQAGLCPCSFSSHLMLVCPGRAGTWAGQMRDIGFFQRVAIPKLKNFVVKWMLTGQMWFRSHFQFCQLRGLLWQPLRRA